MLTCLLKVSSIFSCLFCELFAESISEHVAFASPTTISEEKKLLSVSALYI